MIQCGFFMRCSQGTREGSLNLNRYGIRLGLDLSHAIELGIGVGLLKVTQPLAKASDCPLTVEPGFRSQNPGIQK